MDFSISLFEFDICREVPLFFNFTILEFSWGGGCESRSMFCIYIDEDIALFELAGVVLYRKDR